jgi:hypothetical protein
MACSTYIHNDPIGGSKYVSGTTCTGAVVNYTLTFGQSVCMDDYLPLTLENGLTNLGECIGVTPTPTPSPVTYCITSGKTFTTVDYYCGFNGVTYQNVYGNITLSVPGSQHPDYSITLTNGMDFSTVSIPNGQTFTEYVYPQVIYSTGNGVCDMQNFNDWYIYTANTSLCIPPTPTPTSTPAVTPTNTQTPTPSITPTKTVTPTGTPTGTPTPTPTGTYYYYKVQLYDCNTCTTIGGTSLAISNTLLTINDYYAFQSIPNRKYLILQLETPGSFAVDFRNPGSVSSNSDCALLTCF